MQKVAVVTGSAKGLGRAIALALAEEKFTLVVHYRESKKEAEKVLREIRELSPRSILTKGNLTDENQVKKIFDLIIQKFKRVDLLVNNVGNFLYKSLQKTSNEEFKNILESNVYTTLFCSKAVLLLMRRQKSGHIINIGV